MLTKDPRWQWVGEVSRVWLQPVTLAPPPSATPALKSSLARTLRHAWLHRVVCHTRLGLPATGQPSEQTAPRYSTRSVQNFHVLADFPHSRGPASLPRGTLRTKIIISITIFGVVKVYSSIYSLHSGSNILFSAKDS